MTAESQSRRAWLSLRGRRSGGAAPTDPSDRLAASYAYCAALMREKARTFAFATRWFPPDVRRDISAIYGFFRTIDDLVDERPADSSTDAIRRQLHDWREWLRRPVGTGDPVRVALADLLTRRALPLDPLLELIDGCESDLERVAIHSADELDHYCYQVAGTVGVTMAALLGATTPAAIEAAGTLGKAMQRTNLLRDLGEDGRRGRVYLPADALAAAGVTRDDVLAGR
ncbi:MAG: phytoene/squalene synthase family protein, partial [Dehalococcoidia bacterium]|nr:phytoene/squalene synthase family protein [Dehalococcoidia bacterium]